MSDQPKEHRDHRELGQELDLFSFHDIAPGAPFWHGNGMIIFRELEKAAREINDGAGFHEISTPIMVKNDVFQRSGHWDHYRDNMFYFDNPRDEDEHLVIKPMNCPESTYVYNSRVRSYRDLPIRLAEIGRLHRNELSGTLGGLFRVRQITMDDAHIYCRPDQVEEEAARIMKNIAEFYTLFNFPVRLVLATKPEKALGTKEEWDLAETALKNALEKAGLAYTIEEGEGAFYGPKIEAHLNDSQGRDWQMGTAQLDLVMLPKKFETTYTDEDGAKKLPWVIHRAVFGSFERFIGVLLEHFNGKLPLWLSPMQAEVVPVGEKHLSYATDVAKQLRDAGIRAQVNEDNATVSKKIRGAEMRKVPYILVVGDREIAASAANVRHYRRGDDGTKTMFEVSEMIRNEIVGRTI